MKNLIVLLLLSMTVSLINAQERLKNERYTSPNAFVSVQDTTFDQQAHLYYYQQLKKANTQRSVGVLLIVAGTGMFIGGVSVMASNLDKWMDSGYSDTGNGAGAFLTLAGCGAVGAGIPLTIVGGTNKRKYHQKIREMEKRLALELQFGEYGAGLVLKF